MDIPYTRWHGAIAKRHSRRQFDISRPIDADTAAAIEKTCREFRPFSDARVVFVQGEIGNIFRGFLPGYGKVRGAPAFLAVIGDKSSNTVNEDAGYTGEGVVLEANTLGLETCWIAMFKKQKTSAILKLEDNEAVLAVIPVGHAKESVALEEKMFTGLVKSHRRRPVEELVKGKLPADRTSWQYKSIEAARLAPSALNRQPWVFETGETSITVSVRTGGSEMTVPKRLDCGIAMLHIEAAAGNSGVKGRWESLEPPQVARFSAVE